MAGIEFLDKAADLALARIEEEGLDVKTLIALLTFYLLFREKAGVRGSEHDDRFYNSLQEDFGAECMAVLEVYIATHREKLDAADSSSERTAFI